MKKVSKILIPVLILALVLSLSLSMVACKKEKPKNENTASVQGGTKDKILVASSTSALMGSKVGASGGAAMAPMPEPEPELGVDETGSEEPESPEPANPLDDHVFGKTAKLLSPYMDLVETYTSDDAVKYEDKSDDANFKPANIDKDGYNTKYLVTYKDAMGKEIQIKIFADVKINNERTIDLDELDNVIETETEVSFKLDGYMEVGGKPGEGVDKDKVSAFMLTVESEEESETGKDGKAEHESELKVVLKGLKADGTEDGSEISVKIEKEHETGKDGKTENEFSIKYVIKQDDAKLSEFKLTIEDEVEGQASSQEIKFAIKTKGVKDVEFKIKKEIKSDGTIEYSADKIGGLIDTGFSFKMIVAEDGNSYTVQILDKDGNVVVEGSVARYGFASGYVEEVPVDEFTEADKVDPDATPEKSKAA